MLCFPYFKVPVNGEVNNYTLMQIYFKHQQLKTLKSLTRNAGLPRSQTCLFALFFFVKKLFTVELYSALKRQVPVTSSLHTVS